MFEIIKVRDKFEMQQISERSSLSIMEMGSGAEERAAKCEAMRGFKESVAKAERKKARKARIREEINNAFGGGIFIGAIILGLLAISVF